MAQSLSSCLCSSLKALHRPNRAVLERASAAGVSGFQNRQTKLHQHSSPSCSASVKGAVATHHLEAPTDGSIAAKMNHNFSRQGFVMDCMKLPALWAPASGDLMQV